VHRADACANLAVYLKIRFDVAGQIALLDEAIKFEYEVLSLRPEGHPKRPEACANIAVSLKARFRQTGDCKVLNEAVQLEREALRLCTQGHSDRVTACTHLAASLLTLQTMLRSRYTAVGGLRSPPRGTRNLSSIIFSALALSETAD
jgi:hypothetical protein